MIKKEKLEHLDLILTTSGDVFMVTKDSRGELYASSRDNHCGIDYYLKNSLHIREGIVYRLHKKVGSDIALLMRTWWKPCFEPSQKSWLEKVSMIPEYTMEQLTLMVGHEFKVIK